MADALAQLIRARDTLSNIGSGTWTANLLSYQMWASRSTESLGYHFDHGAVEQLITTRRHWWLMDQAPSHGVREFGLAIQDALRAEQTDRRRALNALVDVYRAVCNDWQTFHGKVVIPDTNVYMHNQHYWDEIDWTSVVGDGDVRLMIPSGILRELDQHKRSDRNSKVSDTNSELLRTRARVSSRRIRMAFETPRQVVRLKPSKNFYAELLLDDLRHLPATDADTEIIGRALDLQRLISRPVTIVTGDSNMQFQAEIAGLQVVNMYEAGH